MEAIRFDFNHMMSDFLGEGKGISRLVRETCDVIMSVPTTDWVESLNASVAAGVVLSEFARQRRLAT